MSLIELGDLREGSIGEPGDDIGDTENVGDVGWYGGGTGSAWLGGGPAGVTR